MTILQAPGQLQQNMVMNLLSLTMAVVKLSYDGYAQSRINSINDFNSVIDLNELRRFIQGIRYMDIVVL